MFKIKNQDTYCLLRRYFTPCSSVSIVLTHFRPKHTIVIYERQRCCSTDLETIVTISRLAFHCSKSAMETLEQGVK